MLELRIAIRYLFSKKSRSVINIISGVSVFAVIMPVAAMIVLLSVFNGFEGLVREMATAFDADLTLTPRSGERFRPAELDTAALRTTPGVASLSFAAEQQALVEYRGNQSTVTVRGVDEAYTETLPVAGTVYLGDCDLRRDDRDRALAGQALSYALGIRSLADDEPLTLYALRRNSFSTLLPIDGYTRRRVDLAGLYQVNAETEQSYLLVPLRLAQELFDIEGQVTALYVRVDDPARLEAVRQAVARAAGDRFEVRTRYELRRTFYDIMTYEKWGIFFISLLVLLIASFSMIGALTMLLIEKRDERTTLRALGADTRLIRRIFIGEGLLIGALGLAGGMVLGVAVTLGQQHFGWIEIPAETALLRSYPVDLRAGDLAAVALTFAAIAATISVATVRRMIPKQTL